MDTISNKSSMILRMDLLTLDALQEAAEAALVNEFSSMFSSTTILLFCVFVCFRACVWKSDQLMY